MPIRADHRIVAASAAVALGLACVLTGCLPRPEASPTPNPTPAATAGSASDGFLAIATQAPTTAPATRRDALVAANRTIVADDNALFDIFAGTISGGSMSSFETGATLKNTNEFIDAIGDGDNGPADGVIGQANLWAPDDVRSTASTVTVDGRSYPFGRAVVFGCYTDRWQINYTSPDPTPAAPRSAKPTPSDLNRTLLPYRLTVQYQPSKRVWLISEQKALTGAPSAGLCATK
jgi:hypothetical protein